MPQHELQQISERQVFDKGQVILAEGQHGSAMYVVESGSVLISKQAPKGQREIARVGPGGVFGEMALIDDRPRMASATAEEMTVCRVVRRDKMNEKLKRSDPFVRAILKILVKNLRDTAEQLN